MKDDNLRKISELETSHRAERDTLQSRVTELNDSDAELQAKLKELTDKLTSTEEKLVEFTGHSQKTI